jgi:hypothetical protein
MPFSSILFSNFLHYNKTGAFLQTTGETIALTENDIRHRKFAIMYEISQSSDLPTIKMIAPFSMEDQINRHDTPNNICKKLGS